MFKRAWCGTIVHGEDLKESGNRTSPWALSLDRPGSNPSRPFSPSRETYAYLLQPKRRPASVKV